MKNVGKQSSERGGPAAQAIRNQSGARYRSLIEVYQEQHAKTPTSKNVTTRWVESIESPTIRWLVEDLIAEKKRLKAQNRTATHCLGQCRGSYHFVQI